MTTTLQAFLVATVLDAGPKIRNLGETAQKFCGNLGEMNAAKKAVVSSTVSEGRIYGLAWLSLV